MAAAEIRLARGDRVALMMPNILQYPIALFGALRAGMVVVNTNPLYTPRELEHQLKDSGAKAIVIVENFAHVLQQVLARTDLKNVLVTGVGDLLGLPKGFIVNFVLRHVRKQIPPWKMPGSVSFKDALGSGLGLKLEPVELGGEDIAFLQYTGGTTGVAKAAVLTHRNMVANVLQALAWIKPALQAGGGAHRDHRAAAVSHLCAHQQLPGLPALGRPQCADHESARFPGVRGGTEEVQIQLHQRRQHAVQCPAAHAGVRIGGLQRAARHFRRRHGGAVGGGGALERSHRQHRQPRLGADRNLADGHRQSHRPASSTARSGCPFRRPTFPFATTAGKELPVNGVGEICVFGPQVMRGYWNRPDETENVMFGDWLRTGDIGRMDDEGFVYIEDRKKDMILVSGFNVYPNEVESVAAEHPGVLEVAAVAQPDENSGEVVALFVVKKDPNLTAEALIAHLPHRTHRLQSAEACVFSQRAAQEQCRQDSAPRPARRTAQPCARCCARCCAITGGR